MSIEKRIVSIYFICFIILAVSCNYITIHRHINVDLDDNKTFEQSGSFAKAFDFYAHDLINAITENIDAKDARIGNLQIETLQLDIAVNSVNTATSIHNVHIKLAGGWGSDGSSLAKLDTSRIIVNRAAVIVANTYWVLAGVEKVKAALIKNLVSNQDQHFTMEMTGLIPTSQLFSGNVKLILKATLDAVTCERVPFG